MRDLPLLSILVFLPLVGGGVILFLGRNRTVIKTWALLVALADLALACLLWGWFDYGIPGLQYVDWSPWLPSLGIEYTLGMDGINLWFLLLTTFLSPVAVGASWRWLDGKPPAQARAYLFLLLALETGVLGVFSATDLILFFVFWEATLIPAYFLVGRWGAQRRVYATTKLVLYTVAGSALMLVAIIVLALLHYQASETLTFDRLVLSSAQFPASTATWLFLAFALAFAVKTAVWPLHSWLPDAYTEAPAPVCVLLSGCLSKMGIYGLIRLCLPLFPDAVVAARPWLWSLAIAGILYASLVALAQRDIKRVVAYSSMAHLGLLFAGALALNVQGVQGTLLLAVAHGLTASGLFLLVDWLEVRRGTREIGAFGGLWKSIPHFGTLCLTVMLASIAVPGLSGFPGEVAALIGVFLQSPAAAGCAALGTVLGTWVMLHLFRRAFAGPLDRAENRGLPDLQRREAAILLPLVVLMFLFGILPNLILRPTDAAVNDLLRRAEERRVVLYDDTATGQLAGSR